MRYGPIVVGVLQSLADGFVFQIAWNEAEPAVMSEPAVVIDHRTLAPQSVSLRVINAWNLLHIRFGQHWGRVVPDHATGFNSLQRPHRNTGRTLLGHKNHGVQHV